MESKASFFGGESKDHLSVIMVVRSYMLHSLWSTASCRLPPEGETVLASGTRL